MRVQVIFPDQKRGVIGAEELQESIQSKKVTAFFREHELITVDVDPIRGKGGRKYSGPERRGNSQNLEAH